ncbi:MAG: sulfite exporter TauE/SafE family protein [Alphaproteobacteria bacterium]|nr:sulfite exporter TauE/SafE family protein [Alphaproteobacteria bacterium]
MAFDLYGLAVVAAVFAVAGLVKGVIGFGLPSISMGLLSALVAPELAAAILVVPTFLTNVWQAFAGSYTRAVLRRFWPMFAGVFAGTLATSWIITGAGSGAALLPIGAILLAYGTLGLSGVRFRVPRRVESVISPVVGLITGLINGATAIFVLPGAPYLQATETKKTELIQALGFVALCASGALALGFGLSRPVDTVLWPAVLTALAAALAGMASGQIIRGRLSVAVFQRWVFIGLAALGVVMIARAFG